MTYEDIYKKYKHGESLEGIDLDDIYDSLDIEGLNVYWVMDSKGSQHIWNYIPETNKMVLVI